jgi:hypothetical protein
LDLNRRLLIAVVAYFPVQDDELDFVSFTDVDALVECLSVKKMSFHVEVDKRVHSFDASVLQLQLILFSFGLFIQFSQSANIFEIWSKHTLAANNRVVDFNGQLIFLNRERRSVGGFDYISDKRIKCLSKMIAGLFWHLGWQMVDTVE